MLIQLAKKMSDATSLASNEVANELIENQQYRVNSMLNKQSTKTKPNQQKDKGLPKDLGERVNTHGS